MVGVLATLSLNYFFLPPVGFGLRGHVRCSPALADSLAGIFPEELICVSVKDEGPGIPEAEKVFEEVHRVEQSRGNVRFRLVDGHIVIHGEVSDVERATVAENEATAVVTLSERTTASGLPRESWPARMAQT